MLDMTQLRRNVKSEQTKKPQTLMLFFLEMGTDDFPAFLLWKLQISHKVPKCMRNKGRRKENCFVPIIMPPATRKGKSTRKENCAKELA